MHKIPNMQGNQALRFLLWILAAHYLEYKAGNALQFSYGQQLLLKYRILKVDLVVSNSTHFLCEVLKQ